jgi:hypothetical protein
VFVCGNPLVFIDVYQPCREDPPNWALVFSGGAAVSKSAQWAIFLLAGVVAAPAVADSCIWFSHDDSIRQVQTSTNQVTQVVQLRNPHRLLMNAEDCGVWTLDRQDRRILRFSPQGELEREIRVRDLDPKLDEVEQLHLDSYDGSLWVTNGRRIIHVSASGERLGSVSAPSEIQQVQLALDQTLWVLGKHDLWHFDTAGKRFATYSLGHHLAGDARYFAIDNIGGQIWLADDNELTRLKLSGPVEQPPLRVQMRRDIMGFTLDPYSGNVWIAQRESLLVFSRAGSLAFSVDLNALNIRTPEKLGFDPVSRSIWAGAEKSISRFTDTGQFVIRFSAKDGDEALGVPAFKVRPTLTLIRPPQDALTNNAHPEFRLGYGAECNGMSCGFLPSYFSSYQLTAALNGQPVGSAFQFDRNTGESFYVPPNRLPEGLNSFSTLVRDAFGHSSTSIENSFNVDTVPPRFLALAPADGSVFQSPQVVLRGTIDDPHATVVLVGFSLSQTGQSFGFPMVLAPGLNTFTLTAFDPSGNAATATRRFTFTPVSVTIEAPSSGTSVASDSVIVTGSFQGALNTGVTVNGVVALIAGDRFYAQVPLQPGSNLLTATAATPDGFTATQAIGVTSEGTGAISVTSSPPYGLAPFRASFELRYGTEFVIRRIDADFNGDGVIDFSASDLPAALEYAYATPGLYTARFTFTDDRDIPHMVSAIVQAEDPARLDQRLRAVWANFLQAAGDRNRNAVMNALSVSAREVYGPVYDELASALPQIVASFSAPQSSTLTSTVGEYAVNRTIDGANRIFFIYFLRDGDGVWRIDSM